jgi:acyl-CoA reductase-like NAD-dependent aldehyde dehydrogenase
VEEGIAEGNTTTYGLAAAVWTRDVAKALRAARAIRAGTVWVNVYSEIPVQEGSSMRQRLQRKLSMEFGALFVGQSS